MGIKSPYFFLPFCLQSKRITCNDFFSNIDNLLDKKILTLWPDPNFRMRLDKYCWSPIWEFSLEKYSFDTKSFFKYIRFFIKILNLFAFFSLFFSHFIFFFLTFCQLTFLPDPPLADAMLTKFSNLPPLSGVSWYVDDPLVSFFSFLITEFPESMHFCKKSQDKLASNLYLRKDQDLHLAFQKKNVHNLIFIFTYSHHLLASIFFENH